MEAIGVAVAAAGLFVWLTRHYGRQITGLLSVIGEQHDQWQRERRELLNRIQAPARVPVEPGEAVVHEPPEDTAELAKVGTLDFGDGGDGDPEGV